jgi:hypothetical protein
MNQLDGLYGQYLEIKDHKVLVSFKGALSQEVLSEFGTMIRSSLSAETNTKRIFAVFVELAQNIVHYSAEHLPNFAGNAGVGIIILKERQNLFFLSSGNMVSNHSVEKIRAKVEKVNAMNKDELKAFYQELIRGVRPADGSKGAGLGLVDIARKVDGPISCIVDPIDDVNSFLTLSVFFKKDSQ